MYTKDADVQVSAIVDLVTTLELEQQLAIYEALAKMLSKPRPKQSC